MYATLPPFPRVRPDVVLGLHPFKVPVSVGVDATPLVPSGIKAGLYAASIPNLQTSLCDCEYQTVTHIWSSSNRQHQRHRGFRGCLVPLCLLTRASAPLTSMS